MTEFLTRLKQRKLVQWALAYAAFAFALMQGLDIVAQQFGWPEGARRGITLALVVGLFVVLVLAWYHGERGAQRVGSMEIMILALPLAIGGTLIWRFGPAAATRAGHSMTAGADSAVAIPPDSTKPARVVGSALPVPAASIPEKSVAVLPFVNEGGDKDRQFFSDGLSEDLITALSQFAGLKVINRDSSFRFRGSRDSVQAIAEKLGVAHLLEGTVQRGGDEVRITATLVNAADGSILWSQRYDRPYKDLFALQDTITQAVAGALKAKLLTAPGAVVQSDRPPGGNLDAYMAYQRGVAYYALGTEAADHKAGEAFSEAIRLDPRYAAAHAQLSGTWNSLASQFLGGAQSAQANAKARAAVNTALKLDPDSALAHGINSRLLLAADRNWTGAEAEARRALQLAPNDGPAKFHLSTILAILGQTQQAADLTRQALQTDPRNANWYGWLVVYLTAQGRLDEAAQASNTAIALQPGAVANHEQLAIIEILRGEPKAALATAQQEPSGVWHDIAITLALQVGPDRAKADAALLALIDKDADLAPYQIAQVYALRRDPDAMFKWLEHARSVRDPGVSYLLFDPLILRYQHDPRFAAFCKKIGLPTTTDAVAMK